jgi:CRISPR/Cas system CSM-associated protein Csm3 (group 7 of RAMP superfamily)
VISFKLRLRALGLLTVGWNVPSVIGPDIVQARKLIVNKGRVVYTVFIPGSSVKGSLRSSAHKVASSYGFKSCGKVKPEDIRKAHEEGICDVCRLFGYPGASIQSPLSLSDFHLIYRIPTLSITRVSLDDRTLTAKRGALYTTEHLPPGAEFSGEVFIEDSHRQLIPLLLLAIAELRTGRFGRRSSVDARIEDGEILEKIIDSKWVNLVKELRNWLWVIE